MPCTPRFQLPRCCGGQIGYPDSQIRRTPLPHRGPARVATTVRLQQRSHPGLSPMPTWTVRLKSRCCTPHLPTRADRCVGRRPECPSCPCNASVRDARFLLFWHVALGHSRTTHTNQRREPACRVPLPAPLFDDLNRNLRLRRREIFVLEEGAEHGGYGHCPLDQAFPCLRREGQLDCKLS